MQGFRDSADTLDYQRRFLMPALWAVLPDLCASLPVDRWVALPVERIFPPVVLEHDVVWADPFDLPANIAGESGSSDAGPDTRRLSGTVRFLRTADDSGRVTGVRVEPRFHLTVRDAIDFCPGNLGACWQTLFTVPLSRLEASGRAYDRPFVVEVDLASEAADAPDTVVAGCGTAASLPGR